MVHLELTRYEAGTLVGILEDLTICVLRSPIRMTPVFAND